MTITHGFLHLEAHGAFDAACVANACLIDLGDFAIASVSPVLAQCFRRGRYDFGALEYTGEWRVPCTIRTGDDGLIPDDAWRFLEHIPGFIDLRCYPQCATDHSGERPHGEPHQQSEYGEIVYAGSAGIEQSGGADIAVLAGVGE